MAETPTPTPTLDKMLDVKDRSQAIGEFLEWLEDEKGVELVTTELHHGGSRALEYVPLRQGTESLLAEFFGIDLDAAEREKRALLDELRAG
jgi:hypothetical protein